MYKHKKSPPKLSRLLRYLADSNRRPRFCRPIPNHSGKVPFSAAKIHLFGEPQHIFKEFFQTKPRADNFSQFQAINAMKRITQYI